MSRITRMTSFLFAALLSALALPAQSANPQAPRPARNPIIKSADLEMDAAGLRRDYQELHPGLYRYSSKAEMNAKFETLRENLSHDLSLRDAYLAFSVFAAQVKCGHTYPNFFNQKAEIAASRLRLNRMRASLRISS